MCRVTIDISRECLYGLHMSRLRMLSDVTYVNMSSCSLGHGRWRQRGPLTKQCCSLRECLTDNYFYYSSFLWALRLVFFTGKGEAGLSCRHLLLPVCVSVLCRAGCLLHPVREQEKSNSVWRGDTCLLAPVILSCE